MELDGAGSKEKIDETRLVVKLECATVLPSGDSDVVVFAEDVVRALETDNGRVQRNGELRAQTREEGVFTDDAVRAL